MNLENKLFVLNVNHTHPNMSIIMAKGTIIFKGDEKIDPEEDEVGEELFDMTREMANEGSWSCFGIPDEFLTPAPIDVVQKVQDYFK